MASAGTPSTDLRFFVNRHRQIDLFSNLLAVDAPKRCILLQADSGYGKTALLREYEGRILERHFSVALIDLRRVQNSRELLSSIAEQLDSTRFPLFRQASSATDTQLLSSETANLQLTQRWFADLSASWPSDDGLVFILIDSYERANVDLHDWLLTRFLVEAQNARSLRIVVAGSVVPDIKPLEHYAVLHHVGGIDKHHWLEWIKGTQSSISPHAFETLYAATEGQTANLSALLTHLQEQTGRGDERKDAEHVFVKQIQDEGLDHLYEAKLLIIGEPGAGKTSLARKIDDPDYILAHGEKTTKGIDVFPWKFTMEDGKSFRVNIWDFGGQEIYYHTHQFFLTRRSLYALVADSRKEDTDFYYWLNAVELLSGNSPLLIINNEKQDRERAINERQLRAQFTNLRETRRVNLATNRGLSAVLDSIKYHIATLDHVGAPLPKTWVRVRDALEKDNRYYIGLDEYLDMCEQNGFRKLEDKLQLSGYLHDLGVCLHFQDDPLLSKTIILKPEWGTDAAYRVLDNDTVKQHLGHFTRSDLTTIWHEPQYANMQGELLQLMINFQLCYEIPDSPNTFIAPQLLGNNQPDYDWDTSHNLIMRFTYEGFMPSGIVTLFIVKMHRLIKEGELVWKSGVVLQDRLALAEVIEHYERREIRIRIAGKSKRDLLTIIDYEFDRIHESFGRLPYKKWIPCNCPRCRGSQEPHFYEFDVLQRFKADGQNIQCQRSYEIVDVQGLIDDVTKVQAEELEQGTTDIEPKEAKPQVFISYAWGGQSEEIVNLLENTFRKRRVTIVRDKRELLYKDLIKEFMQRISRGKAVIVVISDKYLKSPSCMYELTEIAAHGGVYDRIFPIILPDAQIHKPVRRVRYVKYWEEQIKELDDALKDVSAANLQGLREDIDNYTRIRNTIADLTDTLRNMNALTPEMLQNSDFEEVFVAVERRLGS